MDDLTEKQRAICKAAANNDEATNKEVAERVSMVYGLDVSASYVSDVRNSHEEAIETFSIDFELQDGKLDKETPKLEDCEDYTSPVEAEDSEEEPDSVEVGGVETQPVETQESDNSGASERDEPKGVIDRFLSLLF